MPPATWRSSRWIATLVALVASLIHFAWSGVRQPLDHPNLAKFYEHATPLAEHLATGAPVHSVHPAQYGPVFMFVMHPAWSYRLNADFEDHAEHEYAYLVDEHPEWEALPYGGEFSDDFGDYDSLADLFRQIGYDERLHKLESEANMVAPRFE